MGEIGRTFDAKRKNIMSQVLMSSAPYAFLRIAGVCNSLMLNTVLVFLPKIVENFYNVTPSVASTVVGMLKCFSDQVGNLLLQVRFRAVLLYRHVYRRYNCKTVPAECTPLFLISNAGQHCRFWWHFRLSRLLWCTDFLWR